MNMPAPHPREEEAAAYVFGLMDAAERIEFVKAMNADESLRALVDDLNQIAASATLATAQAAPPAAVRARVLDNIKTIPQDGARKASEVVPPRKPVRLPMWMSWAAVALLLAPTVMLWQSLQATKQEVAATKAQLDQSMAMSEKAERIAAEAVSQTKALIARLNDSEKASNDLKTQLAESTKSNADLQQRFEDTLKTTESLKQELAQRIKSAEEMKVELAHLTKANDIAMMQVAMLESTVKEFKQGVAVVVWNNEKQEGILKLEKMPPIQSGKDYNLWVIDSTQKTPVNAGIVRVDDKGFAKVDFKPTMDVQQADKFALSVEAQGGAPAGAGPQGPVVLIGN